ncbi:uncharacterized protein BJ212DRAFT_1301531 [Suillus subaureus]|uniref:Uncharacterized protein n=1 Tax=Suillus subaureus TaxID=48587 RepID=A0A9P7E715_9AGAM|nr:uncharacterized protein BJ212DRAFT_1301531 [Suillus subaureus]KAG1812557.1 hypothetical protein BJ212DRAFT_1301531 [Suillus subaureus]
MSRPFIRNLTFQSNDLGKEATIMLALINGDLQGLYEDFFPIVWKVSTFGKTGAYRAQATYTNQLAFSKAQVVNGNVISAGTCAKLNDGEKTTLTRTNDVYHFSSAQAGTSGVLQAVNKTGAVQDLAIGFMNKGDLMPTPALYFNEVGDESSVKAQFTPILRIYVTSDYQETAILRGAIDTPAIWTQDIAALAENTIWNLKRDTATGRYTIVQA